VETHAGGAVGGIATHDRYIYPERVRPSTQMNRAIPRVALFVLYQLTVFLGIALLPVALFARRAGIPLPLGRAVETTKAAYEASA